MDVVRTSSRSVYTVSPSFSGATIASFHTASQAISMSKPEGTFEMRESAWVPICIDSVRDKILMGRWTHRDIGLDDVLPHRQPTALRRYFFDNNLLTYSLESLLVRKPTLDSEKSK